MPMPIPTNLGPTSRRLLSIGFSIETVREMAVDGLMPKIINGIGHTGQAIPVAGKVVLTKLTV